MKATLGELKHKIYQSVLPSLNYRVDQEVPLETWGSEYGEWVIPKGVMGKESICYLAGAGEDISFDVALAEAYGSEVHIFDPTPRARAHYNALKEAVEKGEEMALPHNSEYIYTISPTNWGYVHYHALGIWKDNETVRFYQPSNENHVSHSILNLQKTDSYFEAEVETLDSIMHKHGHSRIDLLKLDIEGAEYEVINDMLNKKLDVKVLCVEFDEFHNPLDGKYPVRINKVVKRLRKQGYSIVHADAYCNLTFIKR
ncbi:MAG: FkbM family methyltransferase [Bacteroidota bacterium]